MAPCAAILQKWCGRCNATFIRYASLYASPKVLYAYRACCCLCDSPCLVALQVLCFFQWENCRLRWYERQCPVYQLLPSCVRATSGIFWPFKYTRPLIHSSRQLDVSPLPFREKLAFYINMYNALCLHAIYERGPPGHCTHPSHTCVSSWVDAGGQIERWRMHNNINGLGICYNINGSNYSIADFKHGIVRGTRHDISSP